MKKIINYIIILAFLFSATGVFAVTQNSINNTINGVTLVSGGTSTLYLSQDGTYTTPAGLAGSLIVGVSSITGGSTTNILYNNAGTLGEYAVSGSGNVALTTSPVFTTPNIGSATGSISGNAGTATALQNARTIGGVSFDGTGNITVATATGGFTVSGGNLALGTNSLTLTGSIGATGARVTKGWFTDIESTNMPTVGGTSLSSTFQGLDSDLTTIAGLTATTDNFLVSVSSAWASRTPSQVRTTLGLVIGTNVQAYDADLTTWAGVTPGTGVATALGINVGSAGALVTNGGALGTPSSGTLTNATGLPIAGLTASTTTALGVGSVELGHATDTTIARSSAGVATIESARIITSTSTTSGTVLKNNGTTFVASTETYAAPGTSGNVMTSDGTNWTSTAPAGGNPTGAVIAWTTTSAPTGYLIADGAAVSRTTYAALFAVISTTYGVGDGSTTFNLPDIKGRVVVGKSTDTEFDTMGETGGEKTHTLTVPEMPSHTHDLTFLTGGTGQVGATQESQGSGATVNPGGLTIGNTGGGTAHNVLQPYLTLNYIIKI